MPRSLLHSLAFLFALMLSSLPLCRAEKGRAPAKGTDRLSTPGGMVGYWAFDEGRGDSAGNARHGQPDIFGVSGGARLMNPEWVEGRFGRALRFAGESATAQVNKTRDLNCSRQVTIAAWVKLERPRHRGMVLNHEYAYRLSVNLSGQRRVRFQLNAGGRWAGNWLISKTTLTPGKWTYLAGVYDGHERRIYIDGRLDASEPLQGKIAEGRNFSIGSSVPRKPKKRVFKAHAKKKFTVPEAFAGSIDEVKVWNRALSLEEIRRTAQEGINEVTACLGPETNLYFYMVRAVALQGRERPFEIVAFNGGKKACHLALRSRLSDASGKLSRQSPLLLDAGPRQTTKLSIPSTPDKAGIYSLELFVGDRILFTRDVIVLAPETRQPSGDLKRKQVLSIDLASDLGPESLADDGTSRVVLAEMGAYREAGPKKFSRFAVRLPLKRTGLHLVRVTYPDDKVRTCEIATSSPEPYDRFNIHSGYFTGGDYPLSHEFRTVEFVIWARHLQQGLVFTTWLEGQPAAASRVEVFKISGRLSSSPASRVESRRWIGHYWEDAQPLSRCFGGGEPELADFDRVASNVCDYFDFTGQNLLMHPVVWYEGPIYNSLVEPRGGKGGFHLPTDGWLDILLTRFGERGFKFFGLFNVHQLPSLVRLMNANEESIRKGAPTFNSVTRENEAFTKTWHHRLPMLNGLHPRVQARVLALAGELAQRYGTYPAFGGIGFHLTLAQLLMPGSLEVSYDDWTVRAFEKDCGLQVPVPATDPLRFSKRYSWIMKNERGEWIDWRCERVTRFYAEVGSALRKARPDLQLVITLLEPPMSIIDPQREEWRKGKPLIELAREAGIDPARLASIPNLVFQQRLGPTAKRKRLTLGIARGRWGSPPPSPESIQAIRAMDFASVQQRQFRLRDHFGTFLYNRYFENAIGRKRPLDSDWFVPISWRASAVVPSGTHFMEYYAHSLAMLDPDVIAVGGFTNGTVGHEKDVADFASVFRQLPVGNWRDLKGMPQAVTGRVCTWRGRNYLYLVNESPGPKRVTLRKESPMQPIGNSPQLSGALGRATIKLGPYQLAAWVAGQ